jgi:hypothetical protein
MLKEPDPLIFFKTGNTDLYCVYCMTVRLAQGLWNKIYNCVFCIAESRDNHICPRHWQSITELFLYLEVERYCTALTLIPICRQILVVGEEGAPQSYFSIDEGTPRHNLKMWRPHQGTKDGTSIDLYLVHSPENPIGVVRIYSVELPNISENWLVHWIYSSLL